MTSVFRSVALKISSPRLSLNITLSWEKKKLHSQWKSDFKCQIFVERIAISSKILSTPTFKVFQFFWNWYLTYISCLGKGVCPPPKIAGKIQFFCTSILGTWNSWWQDTGFFVSLSFFRSWRKKDHCDMYYKGYVEHVFPVISLCRTVSAISLFECV